MNKRIDVVTLKQCVEKRIIIDDDLPIDEAAIQVFIELVGDADREYFVVFMLDCHNKINAVEICSIGILSCAVIHPREIFKGAILSNAEKILLVHNHPSGDVLPSKADIEVTHNLVRASEILRIPVVDHLIVFEDRWFSFLKAGILEEE